MWKVILVPHDFSASANHAAALARDEAKAHGGRIIMLHVIDLPTAFGPDTTMIVAGGETPIGMRQYALRRATEHIEDLAFRLRADGVDVTAYVSVGHPVDEILRLCVEYGADSIVMGTHGRTGFRHLIAGSVTERVVRASPVPVMTTRNPD